MRSTVGPLPSAVYWRRRAVVLGAVLLGLIVLFVSCSGGDDDAKRGQGGSPASQYPTPAPNGSGPDESPSFTTGRPGGNLPEPGDLTSGAPGGNGTGTNTGTGTGTGTDPGTGTGAPVLPGTGQNGNVNVTAPAGTTCTDAEMAVIPLPATTTVQRGAPLEIRLKIKNIGTRTCSRDVGAVAQELYIDQGAQKVWSSDTCSNGNQSNPQIMNPGAEREFRVTWNGLTTTKCRSGQAAGPTPVAGVYEVRGRLFTKISDPVTLTITG